MTNCKHDNIMLAFENFGKILPEKYEKFKAIRERGLITEEELEKQFAKTIDDFLFMIRTEAKDLKRWEDC